MNMITDLVRMWLTRSVKPFVFTGEFDSRLPYEECEQLGLYVHIPFCRSVCNFCPYCKVEYSKERCDRYIDALIQEIHLVGGRGEEKKRVTSLYFGGGTPALAAGRLKEIIDALGRYYDITEGIGVELHPSDVVLPVLRTLRDAGVTKLSIGIQSFQGRHQAVLGREAADPAALAAALAAVPFETVSMDFIFALPGQTLDELKADIDTAFANGANHIA
ncbi:MAG: radical SAM protein, partial [Oscillospiraceae bacterium]|nr:radical SAM protein [Oscillospiraceae bacterium]